VRVQLLSWPFVSASLAAMSDFTLDVEPNGQFGQEEKVKEEQEDQQQEEQQQQQQQHEDEKPVVPKGTDDNGKKSYTLD